MGVRVHWLVRAGVVMALLALIGATVPLAPAAGRLPSIVDAAITTRGTTTRLDLAIDQRVRYSVFTMSDPYRVVIELDEVEWTLPTAYVTFDDPILDRVRYGLVKPGTSRLVLDCRTKPKVNRVALAGSGHRYRLTIELVPGARVPVAPPPAKGRSASVAAVPKKAPVSTPGPARREAGRRHVVVVDPGHGGADPGARSAGGLVEKTLTLQVARKVRRALERTGSYRVLLTRDRDTFVPLRDRVAFARRNRASVFLSLHADSNPVASLRGASVYTLSEQSSDAEAAALAERENKADLVVGLDLRHAPPEVANILVDLAQRDTLNASARLAALLTRELGQQTPLVRESHRFAGFAVLKAPDVPAVLIELGQLSNAEDEKALRSERHQNQLATAIARGVDRFVSSVEQASLR